VRKFSFSSKVFDNWNCLSAPCVRLILANSDVQEAVELLLETANSVS